MAVGGVASATVTVALQVLVLPCPSFTVSVTVFMPMLLQVKVLGEMLPRLTVPQLSLDRLLTSAAVMLAVPPAPRFLTKSRHKALGAIWSATVTVAVQVPVLPLAPVTVRVTVLAPRLAQVKAVCEAENESVAQPVEPLFILLATRVPLPAPSRLTVTFWQVATTGVGADCNSCTPISTVVPKGRALPNRSVLGAPVLVPELIAGEQFPMWKSPDVEGAVIGSSGVTKLG